MELKIRRTLWIGRVCVGDGMPKGTVEREPIEEARRASDEQVVLEDTRRV